MYRHKYACNECSRFIFLVSESMTNPMMSRLGLHFSLYEPIDELAAYYGIVRVESGPGKQNKTCTGSLRYVEMEAIPAPVAPPVVVRTALTYSAEFANQPAAEGVNTICAAYDVVTHGVKKGVNGHGIARTSLHATLQARLAATDKLEAWSTTNCAEIQAVSKLLAAGSTPANIRVHSRYRSGDPKPPCENCQGWLVSSEGGYRLR